MREKWRVMISRMSPRKPGKLWSVGVKQRVCSKHFIDGEPTYENPAPTSNLGYDSEKKAQRQSLINSRRTLKYNTVIPLI